jgi:Kef-type K+ transport system membrane component KefB
MPSLSETQVLVMLAALVVILLLARAAGEGARRLGQPEVLGVFVAGFLLGPSVLGALVPGVFAALFQETGAGVALSVLSWIGAILLLLIAGLEVDLPILRGEIRTWSLAAAHTAVIISLYPQTGLDVSHVASLSGWGNPSRALVGHLAIKEG